jgi:predicted kinase
MLNEQLLEIAEEHYVNLVKPETAKQPPHFALCMIGLIGAGKSTVLRKLVKRIPMVIHSGDDIRRLTHQKGLPPLPSEDVAVIGSHVIGKLVSQGYRVAYDNDFANTAIREKMMEFNRVRNIPIKWIRFAPPEEFILNNLQKREHAPLFESKQVAIDRYYERKAYHQSVAAELDALPYVYIFDPSRPDIDRQVEEAVTLILA